MKRKELFILWFCTILSMPVSAEEILSAMQAVKTQISNPSVPVEPDVLENIAIVTYEGLLNVPLIGLEQSKAEIETLIALKTALEDHSGLREHLLAIRMQEAIDLALTVEITRRAAYMAGKTVSPPYKGSSLESESVVELLKSNHLAEETALHYIRDLDGLFAKFCKSKNFNAKDFLTGEVARAFPQELKRKLREIQIRLFLTTEKMDRATMEDILFVSTLIAIDHGRDVRILCDIFLEELPASSGIYREQIEQKLALQSNFRVSSGLKNKTSEVLVTASQYIGNLRPKHYPLMLTMLLSPYFSDPGMVATRVDGLYFQYTGEHGVFSGLVFIPGAWLEVQE